MSFIAVDWRNLQPTLKSGVRYCALFLMTMFEGTVNMNVLVCEETTLLHFSLYFARYVQCTYLAINRSSDKNLYIYSCVYICAKLYVQKGNCYDICITNNETNGLVREPRRDAIHESPYH